MLRGFIFRKAQKKINSLEPKVNILLNKELPTPSAKEIANLSSLVSRVNSFESEVADKPASFFKEKTQEFKELIKSKLTKKSSGKEREDLLDQILPFYFALVREAAKRSVAMRHFDVQIVGGIVLHKNKIAEMVTGEGKTLVATLAASLNALVGKGVHVVTVNDYLAKRDSEWMGPVYQYLGLSVGVIQSDMEKQDKKEAYGCDITYGTNNEFGFDYLRDNMVNDLDDMVQRSHFYSIVDEVDSILIDEARTPLIISGPADTFVKKYYLADKAVRQLKIKEIIQSFENKDETITIKNKDGTQVKTNPEELEKNFDAIAEEKTGNTFLTPAGEKKCESILGVGNINDESPDSQSNPWMHYINQSLRAHRLFQREKEYIVKDGKVMIVDEFTGRLMPGRRWSDGLHQAVEAKEGLNIQQESQTLATVTLQNYFRMYDKLAGMTGTAYTEAKEFRHIYKLDVDVIPTNKPLIRSNYPDRIYKTKKAKFNSVIEEINECYLQKRPVLVGTTSIEDSETLAFLLSKKGISHNILNAKYHEKEAHIIAQAGKVAAVTIATNMAGRGTDIVLGGNLDYFIKDVLRRNNISSEDESYETKYQEIYKRYKDEFQKEHQKVVDAGGLHIIGSQRHEARRIDNQLRGRAGRQGDPGSSRFYVSLEDDLMRLFGSERIYGLMDTLGFPEDQPIEHGMITRSLAVAQKRVEGHNFEIRKQLLQYDDIMNKQREVIYNQRKEILESSNISEMIFDMTEEVIENNVPSYLDQDKDILGLSGWIKAKFNLELDFKQLGDLDKDTAISFIKEKVHQLYRQKEKKAGEEIRQLEKMVCLWALDSKWKEHLLVLDHLKEGIHLRGHAQADPLVEYQKETFFAFQEMISLVKEKVVDLIYKAKIKSEQKREVFTEDQKNFVHSKYSPLGKKEPTKKKVKTPKVAGKKVGRNDPCPCGSGKKYKKCCGR
ncbi:MAG: preprotein translocase subunit SecA [Candidatus Omnitrophica bacterium]|nr:preprotein translocase subunit SecA [Candidatus Omnitrophota bacterium]MCF7887788.1 preprotein translocase subunit SecA [Candidatus Omnitrophota bacterium]